MTDGSCEAQLTALTSRVQQLEDLRAVEQLMYAYHHACDGWGSDGTHRDPEAIAELFTPDGVWAVSARQPPPTGRQEIAALARDLQIIPWIVHTVVNPQVQVDGDVATGEVKGLVYHMSPDRQPRASLGVYRLTAIRTDSVWRIQNMSWEPQSSRERFDPSEYRRPDTSVSSPTSEGGSGQV